MMHFGDLQQRQRPLTGLQRLLLLLLLLLRGRRRRRRLRRSFEEMTRSHCQSPHRKNHKVVLKFGLKPARHL
jgi:hypothetical protein